MPDDNIPAPQRKTFFDVARPGSVPTNATSKPVVIGHGVSQADPMMRSGSDKDHLMSHRSPQGFSITAERQDADVPSAPEVSVSDAIDAPINPNSIPLDAAEEVQDVSSEAQPSPVTEELLVAEPETVVQETPAEPFDEQSNEPGAAPVDPAAETVLPARGPAAAEEPQKLLAERTEDTKIKQPKPKRSKIRMGFIIILGILVVAAITVDVMLIMQYFKLR